MALPTNNPNDLDLVGGSLPAFPFPMPSGQVEPGLTKRELFAAMAMQGLCANSIPGSHHMVDKRALEAVQQADALLSALKDAQP